jgi:heat shock protein HslJ
MKLKVLVVLSVVFVFFSCSKSPKKTTWLVSGIMVDCTGETPQACLQVKEEGQKEWTVFKDQIEGFDYEEGFYYKIKIETVEVENASDDGSLLKYTLREILEKSKIPLNLDDGSWLVTRIKETKSFGRNPFIKIDLSQNVINGNTSCNRFTAKIAVSDHTVDISGLSSTEMMCKDFETETLFLEALKDVSRYTLNEEKLQLLDKNDRLLIECKYLKSE